MNRDKAAFMFCTYILENPIGGLYIGYTGDLNIRLAWHNSGKSRYTKNKGPWKVLFSKNFSTKGEAIKFERYLKSLKNPEYIRKAIVG